MPEVQKARGGLNARIFRHRRKNKKIHWHIDLITGSGLSEIPEKVYIFEDINELELVKNLQSLEQPIRGFGASDSPYETHLFYTGQKIDKNIKKYFEIKGKELTI